MGILFWSLIALSLFVIAVLIFRRKFRHVFEAYPARAPSPSTPQSLPEGAELHIDKNVQFTVYRPDTIVPEELYPLLAFAHLAERRPDAPDEDPDPIQEVERQASRILNEEPGRYQPAKLDQAYSVPRKGKLTFVPFMEGCEFNPPEQSILWQRDVHKVQFEMKASNAVDGQAVQGRMIVYLGAIILAEVMFRIKVDSQYSSGTEQHIIERAEPYRKIFASYSHRDKEIVETFARLVQAYGDEYLQDVKTLRSGEVWSEQLEQMIREANIFQLFWSSNSMISEFVKQEWEFALSLNRSNFIRPVYWEKRFPEKKPDLPPETLRRLHFHRLPAEEDRPSSTAEVVSIQSGEPVPQSDHGPLTLRRIPIKALTTVALSILLLAFLVPFQFYQTGVNTNTNVNTNVNINVNANATSNSNTNALPGDELRIQVTPIKDLRLEGQLGSYDVIVRNLGPYAISDVEIVAELPPALEYVSSDPSQVDLAETSAGLRVRWYHEEIQEHGDFVLRIFIRPKRTLNEEEVKVLGIRQTLMYRYTGDIKCLLVNTEFGGSRFAPCDY